MCLSDERLLDLHYDELTPDEAAAARAHLAACPACAARFASLAADLTALDLPAPDGGHRALGAALRLTGARPAPAPSTPADAEILTPEEVADYLKVGVENVMNMLHALPHFVFDGQVRIRKEALLSLIDGLERGRSRVAQTDTGTFFLRRNVI